MQLKLDICSGALLALQSIAHGRSHIWGTAFLIGPGLAITAAHVVNEYRDQGHHTSKDYHLMALGFAKPTSQVWYVHNIQVGIGADVAILQMTYGATLPRRLELTPFEMSAVMPVVGDVVTTMGFAAEGESTLADLESKRVEGGGSSLIVSVGKVVDVYPDGRDRVMAPRACFAAEVETVGAMSGGPVFNADGRVIGFVTSSLEPTDGLPGITLFSMIYDALLIEVQPTWPKGFWPREGGLVKDLIEVEDGWRAVRDLDRGVWHYLAGPKPAD